MEHVQQLLDVGKVKAGGGLIEDVERAAGVNTPSPPGPWQSYQIRYGFASPMRSSLGP
jgi:hypothetical protein